jgi:methionyl aminopeptidase
MQLATRKSKDTLKLYAKAGQEFGAVLKELSDIIQYTKRITATKDLEDLFKFKITERINKKLKGYDLSFPCETVGAEGNLFGRSLCISVNDTVAHGRNINIIRKKDIVSIDTVIKLSSGLTTINLDAAFTMECGIGDNLNNNWFLRPLEALKSIRDNNLLTTNSIAAEIFNTARRDESLSVVSSLCGHGIGREMHEQPLIYNAPIPNEIDVKLINGMCFCPEPIYVKDNSLFSDIILEDDGWSIKTISGSKATHFETTFGVVNGNLLDFVGITNWPTKR